MPVHQFDPQQNRARQATELFLLIVALVLLDQATKLYALQLDSARHTMSGSKVVGLGLLIHTPDKSPLYYALTAGFMSVITLLSPLSRMVKAFWIAAGISNHGEMILRHGSVDFLAVRMGEQIFVANLADLYIGLGILYLGLRMYGIIRTAKAWTEPVNLKLLSA